MPDLTPHQIALVLAVVTCVGLLPRCVGPDAPTGDLAALALASLSMMATIVSCLPGPEARLLLAVP